MVSFVMVPEISYNALRVEVEVLVAQSCPTLCDPMDCSCQAPLSVGCRRQECWSRLPFPSPGDLPEPGISRVSCIAGEFFTTLPPKNSVSLSTLLVMDIWLFLLFGFFVNKAASINILVQVFLWTRIRFSWINSCE